MLEQSQSFGHLLQLSLIWMMPLSSYRPHLVHLPPCFLHNGCPDKIDLVACDVNDVCSASCESILLLCGVGCVQSNPAHDLRHSPYAHNATYYLLSEDSFDGITSGKRCQG